VRTRQCGFTLVELMITVAIIGILAAIAIPAFMQYMRKSKSTEIELSLDTIVKKARVFRLEKGTFPPSGGFLPNVASCGTATGKTPVMAPSVWAADPGFGPLGFHLDEGGYYQYIWLGGGNNLAFAYGLGDIDCDGLLGFLYRALQVDADGNITTTRFDFLDND